MFSLDMKNPSNYTAVLHVDRTAKKVEMTFANTLCWNVYLQPDGEMTSGSFWLKRGAREMRLANMNFLKHMGYKLAAPLLKPKPKKNSTQTELF